MSNGLSALNAFFDALPKAIEKTMLTGAMNAAMEPILEEAKANAAAASGEMRDGLKIYVRVKNGKVTGSIRATGKHAFLANFVEFGTAAHRINAKKGGVLSINGGFAQHVDHPGQKARPFMRPAMDARAGDAVAAAAEYIKGKL